MFSYTLDENGYIDCYTVGDGYLKNGEEADEETVPEELYHNWRAYKVEDGEFIFDENRAKELEKEKELSLLRFRRETECFSVINRSALWYETLTDKQKKELREWYKAWLDVTETLVVPDKLDWL